MQNIKLQVLLPVYNAEEFLAETLDSILNQSYSNFELIILDDASNDGSTQILSSYIHQDPRIRLIVNDRNQGILACRNALLDIASAEFVAFADADDVYHPERLEKQIKFLKLNSEIIVVGCSFSFMGELSGTVRLPIEHHVIMNQMTLINVIPNPAVMLRLKPFNELAIRCDSNFKGAADYLMWKQVGSLGKLANLPDVLFKYRVHPEQESSSNKLRQEDAHIRILKNELIKYRNNISTDTLKAMIWPAKYASKHKVNVMAKEVDLFICELQKKSNCEGIAFFWDIRLRSLCRHNGGKGFFAYVRSRGLKELMKGHHLGLNFALACFRY